MSRILLTLCVGAAFALGESVVVSAQQPTYDDSALRIEGRTGDLRIVRGTDGALVGKIGIFRGIDVAKVVGSSEKATIEAKKFSRDYRPGTLLLSLGIATMGAAIGVSHIHDVNRGITTGLTFAGTALIVWGGTRLERAYNALARSVWWYNRDLVK
jgi:hypothetical protein